MKPFLLAAALVAVPLATPAAAQDAWKSDAFAGYSMLAADGDAWHGWQVGVGRRMSGRLGFVLDLSGHHGSSDGGEEIDVLSLMAGPRLTLGGGRLRPFVHAVAGVVRTKSGIGIFEVDITETSSGVGGAAGGGLDVGFGERWAIRLGSDYRIVRRDDQTVSDPRFSAGIVRRFGTQ